MQEEFKNTNLLSDQFLGLDYIHSNEWTPSRRSKAMNSWMFYVDLKAALLQMR